MQVNANMKNTHLLIFYLLLGSKLQFELELDLGLVLE